MTDQGAMDSSLCEEALHNLASFLDMSMDDGDADRLRAHLEWCESCLEAADVEQHVRDLIRRACCEKAPEALRIRIVSQLTLVRVRDLPL